MQEITEQHDIAQEISEAFSQRVGFGDDFDEVGVTVWNGAGAAEKDSSSWDFPGGRWSRLHISVQGVWVPSLVGPHVLQGQKPKT